MKRVFAETNAYFEELSLDCYVLLKMFAILIYIGKSNLTTQVYEWECILTFIY